MHRGLSCLGEALPIGVYHVKERGCNRGLSFSDRIGVYRFKIGGLKRKLSPNEWISSLLSGQRKCKLCRPLSPFCVGAYA